MRGNAAGVLPSSPDLDKRTRVRGRAVLQDFPVRGASSLTGPYGSGKSAFALFAGQVLGGREAVGGKARALLKEHALPLWPKLTSVSSSASGPALCPVLVTGAREPLESALAAGLPAALRRVPADRQPRGLACTSRQATARSKGVGRRTSYSYAVQII